MKTFWKSLIAAIVALLLFCGTSFADGTPPATSCGNCGNNPSSHEEGESGEPILDPDLGEDLDSVDNELTEQTESVEQIQEYFEAIEDLLYEDPYCSQCASDIVAAGNAGGLAVWHLDEAATHIVAAYVANWDINSATRPLSDSGIDTLYHVGIICGWEIYKAGDHLSEVNAEVTNCGFWLGKIDLAIGESHEECN